MASQPRISSAEQSWDNLPTCPAFPTPSSAGTRSWPRIALSSSRAAGVRLATLIGPGGSSKTRLAIAAAELSRLFRAS